MVRNPNVSNKLKLATKNHLSIDDQINRNLWNLKPTDYEAEEILDEAALLVLSALEGAILTGVRTIYNLIEKEEI